MLSPGQFHLRVPRDPVQNLKFRLFILEKTRTDPVMRNAVRAYCARDFIFWVDVFVLQHNPKKVGHEVGPFILWPWQEKAFEETLDAILNQKDMLWEKSRDMGATWLALLIAIWLCMFHPNKRVIMVSHSEEAVTKAGDEGTLFAKIQFILDNMPLWLQGATPPKKWKKGYRFDGRSTISALASTERSGVGDRCTFVLLDEFSKQRDAYKIWGQTRDTGPRLAIGTHYETSGKYYDLAMQDQSAAVKHPIRKIVMHWSQHPDKSKGLYRYNEATGKIEIIDTVNPPAPDYDYEMTSLPNGKFPGLRSPWYDAECEERANPRDVAMHLDIDPQGASNQFFQPGKIRHHIATFATPPIWVGDVEVDDKGNITEWKRNPEGRLKLWVNLDILDKPPKSIHTCAADVSSGTGASNSALSMMDAIRGEKVLEYLNPHIKVHKFAALSVAVCRWFADQDGSGAKLVWERHGPGIAYGLDVTQELGYRNIYLHTSELQLSRTVSQNPGWVKTVDSERTLLEEYAKALGDFSYVNRSEIALRECLNFVYAVGGGVKHSGSDSKDDLSGARENHGDIVIADALSYKLGKSYRVDTLTEKAPTTPAYGSYAWRIEFHEKKEREKKGWR